MTTVAALSPADRQRLLERLDQLAELDREMRRPGTLASPGTGRDLAGEVEPAGEPGPGRYRRTAATN